MQKKQLFSSIISIFFLLFLCACEDKKEHRADIANIINNKSNATVTIENIYPDKKITPTQHIDVEFSDNMDKNSFSALSVTLKDKQYKSEIEIEFKSVKNRLTIIPIQALKVNKTYILNINTSVTNLAGNTLKKSYSRQLFCIASPFDVVKNESNKHATEQNTYTKDSIFVEPSKKNKNIDTEDTIIVPTNKNVSIEKNDPLEHNIAVTTETLSSGQDFTLKVDNNGSLLGWGENEYGQTANSKDIKTKVPLQEDTQSYNWKSVSAGRKHSNAIKTDGTLWSWGKNDSGELGDATNNSSNTQVQESTKSLWLSSSAGENHTLAIKNDGTLWAWGNNYYGQLGDNTTKNKNHPVQISSQRWKSISAGNNFSIAVKEDGSLWAWGNNENKQLGLNTDAKNKLIPTQIK
jgi:alpha-tubulin suppressor-like RCC1 family protein